MKKKLIPLFVALTWIFLAACGTGTPAVNSPPTTATAAPPVYSATVEYGEPDLITDNAGPLWAYIRYPAIAGPAGASIAQWAQRQYKSAQDEIAGLRQNDPAAEGEINVHFDSYLVDGGYAGILENGIFISSHLAHPTDIVHTFNVDTKTGALLANTDILDYTRLESIFALLRAKIAEKYPDAAGSLGDIDETWLEQIAVGHEGVLVALERGRFLQASLGALVITLPYDELGAAFVLGAQPEPPVTQPPSTEPPWGPVLPNIPPQSGDVDPSKPMVALTFDDGPSQYTPRILDLLERYGARATFCVVGTYVNARRDTVKRAYDLGCEVIGHSWDHRDLSKLSPEEITKELGDTSAVIESATGVAPKLYRPPYGAVNDTLKRVSGELGYALIYWSVDPKDWKTRNADAVYSAVMGHVSDRAIVLSHDLYATTAEAYERILPEMLSKGYQLVTVSELLYYSGKTLEAGSVYYSGK